MSQRIARLRIDIRPESYKIYGQARNDRGTTYIVSSAVVNRVGIDKETVEGNLEQQIGLLLGPRHVKNPV